MTDTPKYEVVKYAAQKNVSLGVTSGMWGILRTTKEVIAFADTEGQAHHLVCILKGAPLDD